MPGVEYREPGSEGRAAVSRIDGIEDLEVVQSTDGGTEAVITSILGSAHCGFPSASPAHEDESKISGYELIFVPMYEPNVTVPEITNYPPRPSHADQPAWVYRVRGRTVGRVNSSGAAGAEPVDDGDAENLLTAPITLAAGAYWMLISAWCKVPYRDGWADPDGIPPYAGEIGAGPFYEDAGDYWNFLAQTGVGSLLPHPCSTYAAMWHSGWVYEIVEEALSPVTGWPSTEYLYPTHHSNPKRAKMFDGATAEGRAPSGSGPIGELLDQHIIGFRINKLEWPTT
jgi:hypothetical protein